MYNCQMIYTCLAVWFAVTKIMQTRYQDESLVCIKLFSG